MTYRLFQSTVLAMIVVAGAPQSVYGQCADGSPPPCRSQTVASVTRRPDAPIDPRTWIVVPFDNLNNNQDIEWLRVGSVNLLYLGMSRWTDIRVIDDERVADYMREVPGAAEAKSLSLAAAIAVAKRAGAGQVVMGDVIKLGSKTTVNAKVFDVKTGQRIRSVRGETTVADSIMAIFGKLAQSVLNVPAPSGASAGASVTNSISAYQEYAEGIAALNRFDLDRGRQHLTRAIELDSTFALAHARLAVLLGWVSPGDPAARQHSEAAARLSGSLPPREQALIKASVAFSRGDFVASCDGFHALVTKDSTDVDAWYGLGDCLYHDTALIPTDGDSTKPRFRADRNGSIHAFLTVLALDPTYHLAYQHVVESYNLQVLGQGQNQWCIAGKCGQVVAVMRPAGDSMRLTPLFLPRDTALYRQQIEEYTRTGSHRAMLAKGRAIAEQWMNANPSEGRARLMFATTLTAVGDIAGADSAMRRAVINDTGQAGLQGHILRLELSLKTWRGVEAVARYDSIRRLGNIVARGPTGPILIGNVIVLAAPMVGRPTQYDSLISASIKQQGAPPSRDRLSRAYFRSVMGVPQDSLVAYANAVYKEVQPVAGAAVATRVLAPLLSYSLQDASDAWPRFDSASTDGRTAAVIAAQRKDTAAMRHAARRLDSLSRTYVQALIADTGVTIVAAEAYLILRDSARALQLTRRWLDSIYTYTSLVSNQSAGTFVQMLAPRAAMMRAELAAALGSRDEARLWYDRLLAVWSKPDPELLPFLDRLRKARAALGP